MFAFVITSFNVLKPIFQQNCENLICKIHDVQQCDWKIFTPIIKASNYIFIHSHSILISWREKNLPDPKEKSGSLIFQVKFNGL